MDEKQKDQIIKHTTDLLALKKIKSSSLFFKSLPMFALSCRRRVILLSLLMILFLIIKFLIFPVTSAIEIISDLTVNINTIIIPVFTVIITGYAIFQALANGKTMITLISVKHQEKSSKFEIYNLYFFGIGIWYLIIIIINFILLVTFKYLPKNWYFNYFSHPVNETVAAILISIYIVTIVNFLTEMKSFIYNLFQVFITSATSTSIEYLHEINEENEKDE